MKPVKKSLFFLVPGILLCLTALSCKGRTADDMIPAGDTVEVTIDSAEKTDTVQAATDSMENADTVTADRYEIDIDRIIDSDLERHFDRR